jgi:Holliday junction resolvase
VGKKNAEPKEAETIVITREQLKGMIEFIDQMGGLAIVLEKDLLQYQIDCFAIRAVNPQ